MTTAQPVALVTGASAGIGAAYARRLAAQGYDLLLVARRASRLEELAVELAGRHGVRAEPLPADLTSDSDLKTVEDRIAREEHLEFLLNNAGIGSRGRFYESPVEIQVGMHRLHVLATLRLAHAALRKMTARGKGAVVNVSSVAAFVCRPGTTSYYATKAWINCFTEGLYLELKQARSPVRVQALCPIHNNGVSRRHRIRPQAGSRKLVDSRRAGGRRFPPRPPAWQVVRGPRLALQVHRSAASPHATFPSPCHKFLGRQVGRKARVNAESGRQKAEIG